ncbi:MAG: tetratricopeptide repeat protein [Geminicoccaceae bacterium]|nr:tetratricopeptide repeat protein [Geminicoccaceae bacterium]MDF2757852.1 tetratricopeptide repeat protein [Thermomicrobiales bacterium]MDF3015358.1 tetratricopeptide repeat protein [Thermomicrobiales bacterium]
MAGCREPKSPGGPGKWNRDLESDAGHRTRATEGDGRFERALALSPDLAVAHNNLGLLLADQGYTGKAARCFERALAIRPRFPEAHLNLGNILKDQWQLEEAAAHYRSALARRPNFGYALGQLVDVLQELCAWDELAQWAPKLDAQTRTALEHEARGESALGSIRRSADAQRHLAIALGWARSIHERAKLACLSFPTRLRGLVQIGGSSS